MMCDVMPTIAEDNISQRSSQFSGEDANFEQLMVSMLDERDKLMDSLREAQERLNETEVKLTDTEKERDCLQRQINANLPQVCTYTCHTHSHQLQQSFQTFDRCIDNRLVCYFYSACDSSKCRLIRYIKHNSYSYENVYGRRRI